MKERCFPDVGTKYDIIGTIGEGSMGAVYKAKHLILDRTVAIKIVHPQLIDSGRGLKRFLREARLSAKLNHQNIVQIYDIDKTYSETGDSFFIVTEFIDGETLCEEIKLLDENNFKEILRIATEIFNGLEHAHASGIVHRDIKPENILITKDRVVKIADFGIARMTNVSDSTVTAAETIIGTPSFMAPEQITADDPNEITGKADYYAVGMILYEMVSKKLPFIGNNIAQILMKQLSELPVRPSLHNPMIPGQLERLIMSLLEKNPDDRPSDCPSIIAEINSILKKISTTPAGPAKVIKPQLECTAESGFDVTVKTVNKNNKSPLKKKAVKHISVKDIAAPLTMDKPKPKGTISPNSAYDATTQTDDNHQDKEHTERTEEAGQENRKTIALFILIVCVLLLTANWLYIHVYNTSIIEGSTTSTHLLSTDYSSVIEQPKNKTQEIPLITVEPKVFIRNNAVDIDWTATGRTAEAAVKFKFKEGNERKSTSVMPAIIEENTDLKTVEYSVTFKSTEPLTMIEATIIGFKSKKTLKLGELKYKTLLALSHEKERPYRDLVLNQAMRQLKKNKPELYKRGARLFRDKPDEHLFWTAGYRSPQFLGGPVIIEGNLFIGTNLGRVEAYKINTDNGDLINYWYFDDNERNYGEFRCFAVEAGKVSAYCNRYVYKPPRFFSEETQLSHPTITNNFKKTHESITRRLLSKDTNGQNSYPSWYILNSSERFKQSSHTSDMPLHTTRKESASNELSYYNYDEPATMLNALSAKSEIQSDRPFKIGWYRPVRVNGKYTPQIADGLFFYTYYEEFNTKETKSGKLKKGIKWFVKCLDPATGNSWTYHTGRSLSFCGLNIDIKKSQIYFSDDRNFHCLDYRTRLEDENSDSTISTSLIPENGEYVIPATALAAALPSRLSQSHADNICIVGPPVLVTDTSLEQSNSFYLLMWMNDNQMDWKEVAGFSDTSPHITINAPYGTASDGHITPRLFIYKIEIREGKIAAIHMPQKTIKREQQAATIRRNRFHHSSSTDRKNNICAVSIGADLLVIKTRFNKIHLPSESVIARTFIPDAEKIGNCEIYENHVYFTLEGFKRSLTTLNRMSFSPSLLRE